MFVLQDMIVELYETRCCSLLVVASMKWDERAESFIFFCFTFCAKGLSLVCVLCLVKMKIFHSRVSLTSYAPKITTACALCSANTCIA